MLTALFASLFPLLAAPPQQPSADTTRLVAGILGQKFAWGTAVLRKGQVLRAYLPATNTGGEGTMFYYLSAPDSKPRPKPKMMAVNELRWMRVQGQYSEVLRGSDEDLGRLATRRSTGAVELFVAEYTPPVVVNFLDPTPVMSSPATSKMGTTTTTWYLRAPAGKVVLIDPEKFASQVPPFFAKDAELARRIAAGKAGYGFAQLESLVQQYNQRAR